MAFPALFLVPLPGAMNLLGLPELSIIHNPHAHFGKPWKPIKWSIVPR